MRNLFMGFAAYALLFTSCSNDVEIKNDLTGENGRITFSTYGQIPTKGTPINGNEDLQTNYRFGVAAFDETSIYMGADTVGAEMKYDNSPTSQAWIHENASEARYWPLSGSLSFYAYAPFEDVNTTSQLSNRPAPAFDVQNDKMTFGPYTIPEGSEQKDFMYAHTEQEHNDDCTVHLEFKHALTQIVFEGVVGDGLKVDLESVEIFNVAETGMFSLTGNTPAWSALKTQTEKYAVKIKTGSFSTGDMTDTDGALMLIPQTFAAWIPDPDNNGLSATDPQQTGAYVKVSAKIKAADNDAVYYLGSAGDYGATYIPLASADGDGEWTMGKKITYTIHFGGDDNSGHTDDGEDLLCPIKFTTDVTPWTEKDVTL